MQFVAMWQFVVMWAALLVLTALCLSAGVRTAGPVCSPSVLRTRSGRPRC